jgi:hypothetical protein
MILKETFKCLVILFFAIFISNKTIATEKNFNINLKLNDVSKQCEMSLEWYTNNPGLKGEFLRVLEYCKKYAKDLSPEGFEINPILSDFGSMSGVNTRPRDTIHQGIDIIGPQHQPIIAIADGKVLETTIEDCWGGTLVIDHGKSHDEKNLITIYGHVGDFLVKENDIVKRGQVIARLPKEVKYRCMARVRHLHLQIGQRYCQKEEKDNWGCKYFIKDYYRSLNPHNYWSNGSNKVTCFEKNKNFAKGTLTFPLPCKKIN